MGKLKKYLTMKNLGWLITAMVAFMLGMGGMSKLLATDEMVKNFEFMNLSPYLAFVGLLEVISVVLLILPRTAVYGAILVGSIMSAAVVPHLSMMNGDGVMMPIMIGVMGFLGYYLRTHEIKIPFLSK